MKYAVVFSLIALILAGLAFLYAGWAWLLLWPALSFAIVASGYAGLGPRVFGKDETGRLPWWSIILLLPYLLLTWTLWAITRLVTREPGCHEIAPGLWLGRRPVAHEIPPGVVLIVDLTAEFSPSRGVCAGREYLALPTLDATAPDETRFLAVLGHLVAHPGPLYIHCAAGHGRSALLAAALLLARGLASDERDAVAKVRLVRPGIRLNPSQRRLLRLITEARN